MSLTDAEIHQLATDWYRGLDVHAPMVELLGMLAHDDVRMVFPEGVFNGLPAFERWYSNVIRLFFDETHTVAEVDPAIAGDTAEVKIVVRWEASRWTPPAARSERLRMDAYQTWTVVRSPDGRAVISEYVVDKIEPLDGSAPL